MSEWRGLHNPERHRSIPDPDRWGDDFAVVACLDCETNCYESMPCRCCLAAEVERLTAERDALRAGGAVAQAAAGKRIAELAAEVERLSERPSLKQHEHVVDMGRALQDEVERLTAKLADRDQHIEAALAFCEQQAKDRSLYGDDREKYELAYIDGWNDALDRVEQFLRGESDE